ELVAAARRRLLWSGLAGGVVLLAALLLVTAWVIAPLERLTWYARRVRDGEKPPKPDLPGRTLHELGTAFEEMRDALEGRQHAERYTQALAHEVKAPLAAIRAAAELMDEDMPETQRRKFLENIRGEVARVQAVIERLLELTTLEARKTLAREDRMTASTLVAEATAIVRAAYSSGGVALDESVEADVTLLGDRVLLREALVNLLQNALDFSAKGSRVTLTVRGEEGRVRFVVEDEGAGVPDYALARVFERFYSLPRPGNGRKSTGLGLTLVREIAHLHGGDVTLENRAPRGARAVLWLRT
ncbi:MAG TPA: ATP-binding protein, partial [Candidatus Synoicihabitans sp.]|nr:ATP-binding protein [Candidatus Synoicihabitans sp.]